MKPPAPRPRHPAVFAFLFFSSLLLSPASRSRDEAGPRLLGVYETWVRSVEPLISEAELRVFRQLPGELERELFIRRFWAERKDDDLERWHRAAEAARESFRDAGDERSRAMLTAGVPAERVRVDGCDGLLRPLEIWRYDAWQATRRAGHDRGGFTVLFYREKIFDPRSYRHWPRHAGLERLTLSGPRDHDWVPEELLGALRSRRCSSRAEALLRTAFTTALDPFELRRQLTPEPPDPGWLADFRNDLDGGLQLPAGPLEIAYTGQTQKRTVVRGRLAVPAEELQHNPEGAVFDQVIFEGDVYRSGRLRDSFRLVHYLAGTPPAEGIRLDFRRRLAPGPYTLELRASDARGLGLWRGRLELEVPTMEGDAPTPAGDGLAALVRPETAVLTTFPSLELRLAEGILPVGQIEVVASTTGGPIESVEFRVDGQRIARDTGAPYGATLDLGSEPRRRVLEAVAIDPSGRELARDRRVLELPERFEVHLLEPRPDGPAKRIRTVVEVPAGEELERVELTLDGRVLATLREPPFEAPLPTLGLGATHYVRAEAVLTSGERREDLVILTPARLEEIEVQLVELYVSVDDAAGRPIRNLGADDFRVLENGEPRPLERVERVENLSLSVALLMDVSSSMRRRVEVASQSARRFFENVLRPEDRASLWTFNHETDRAVDWTSDVELLRHGSRGFRAWGTTRLHDATVYTLHGFGGLGGQRALIVLSDGQDVDSTFGFKQVKDVVLRSGVTIYPIALAVEDPATLEHFAQLASASGGRIFTASQAGALDRIYRLIEEELRSQYLLVFQPGEGTSAPGEPRQIEVELLRGGLPEGIEIHFPRAYLP